VAVFNKLVMLYALDLRADTTGCSPSGQSTRPKRGLPLRVPVAELCSDGLDVDTSPR
jgi:hypothetical protein